MKELILLISLLGADTHKAREKAQADLIKSEHCFECIIEYYPKYKHDPEIYLRLREILWHRYSAEHSEKYIKYSYRYNEFNEYVKLPDRVDLEAMERDFKIDLKHHGR